MNGERGRKMKRSKKKTNKKNGSRAQSGIAAATERQHKGSALPARLPPPLPPPLLQQGRRSRQPGQRKPKESKRERGHGIRFFSVVFYLEGCLSFARVLFCLPCFEFTHIISKNDKVERERERDERRKNEYCNNVDLSLESRVTS